jgi:hypothetical protein
MYTLYSQETDQPLNEIERNIARKAFKKYMQSIPERLEILGNHVHQFEIKLDFTGESLVRLHTWFINEVLRIGQIKNNKLDRLIISYCIDISIYMGECVIRNSSGVHWKMFTSRKKSLAYHKPVLMGFGVWPIYKNEHIDFENLLTAYCFRLLRGFPSESPDYFRKMVNDSLSRALKKPKTK